MTRVQYPLPVPKTVQASIHEWRAELSSIVADIADGVGVEVITARLTGLMADVAKHDVQITPRSERQPVPGDLNPVGALEAQIAARDERIAKLLVMVEEDTRTINRTAVLLARANRVIADLSEKLGDAQARIAELDAAV